MGRGHAALVAVDDSERHRRRALRAARQVHAHVRTERRLIVDFSQALPELCGGHRLTRKGWNGDNIYVVYQRGYPDGIAINANTAAATGMPEGTVCRFRPYLMMFTANSEFVPWVASQTDLLAD